MQAGQATLKAFALLDVEDEAFWAKAWGHEKSRPTLVCLGQALPANLQPVWLKMVSWDTWAKLSKDDELSMRPLMEYIQRNDEETLPFRTALPHERLADCGVPDYFHGPVGLQELATEVVVGDMTGNIFKKTAGGWSGTHEQERHSEDARQTKAVTHQQLPRS